VFQDWEFLLWWREDRFTYILRRRWITMHYQSNDTALNPRKLLCNPRKVLCLRNYALIAPFSHIMMISAAIGAIDGSCG